ncbi:MAG TPA: NHL repeat-containing protein [Rhodanobacteraceae bacterium]|nr:NHL repeat-containing protein [Rhodanobacteraceae bacterium]
MQSAAHGFGPVLVAVLVQSISTVEAQTIDTIAGDGNVGFSGDGGQATDAEISEPVGAVVDAAGNFYFADSNNQRIRKVTGGIITTFAGNGVAGYAGDGGPATEAQLHSPAMIAVDGAGNLYIADTLNAAIRKVSTGGIITTFAGTGLGGFSGDGGPATSAQLFQPVGVAFDAAGDLYIGDGGNQRIRKVATDGTITTVAGNGTFGFAGDGGPATEAELRNPAGVAVDGAGNLFIADTQNERIRRVAPDGTIDTIAGNGTAGFGGDGGPGTAAELSFPLDVGVDAAGDVFVADTLNNRIRKVTPDGTITTVAGNGQGGFSGDGGDPVDAEIASPNGVFSDRSATLYISDTANVRIRKVLPDKIFANGFD